MHRLFHVCLVAAMALLLAAPVLADDDEKKKRKKKQRPGVAGQVMKRLAKAELSDEQKAKIKDIVAKHAEKLAAANKKVTEIVGADARKKMSAARKKAAEDGKKGKELQAAVNAALGLSDDKMKAYKEAQAAAGKIRGEMNKAVFAVLSAEQREKAGIKVRGQAKKKGAAKKKKKKDADK